MWCKFGRVTLGYPRQRNPRIPPRGEIPPEWRTVGRTCHARQEEALHIRSVGSPCNSGLHPRPIKVRGAVPRVGQLTRGQERSKKAPGDSVCDSEIVCETVETGCDTVHEVHLGADGFELGGHGGRHHDV